MSDASNALANATTSVIGLDDVLNGGFSRGNVFLVEGAPGAGKTTLALQFLIDGAARGEKALYVTLSETEDELRQSAATHGWSLDGIDIYELVPPERLLADDHQQSLLYSADLELGETTREIFEAVSKANPDRLILDSLSEIRLLAQSSLRFRRQVLAIKHYFSRRGTTVLMLDDMSDELPDKTVHSVVHGVIQLQERAPVYGAERRRLRVSKYRGRKYRGGYHDFIISTGGLQVFPRLVAAEYRPLIERPRISSGDTAFDALAGGGLRAGTSTLIMGPAGTGKSLLGWMFVAAAVARGDKAAVFSFDEETGLLIERMKPLGIDIQAMRESGGLVFEQVDAAELSPGQFAHLVRQSVDNSDVKMFLVDSLNGRAAMPEETALILHMHELMQYLNRRGAATFLTVAQEGLVGDMRSPVDITYLGDTVVLLRYFESLGRIRRAMSIVKQRAGNHEDTIREYHIGSGGITIGDPLVGFQGVLRGIPSHSGTEGSLPPGGTNG